MSLINQMLSDLELRRGGSLPSGAGALDGLQAAGGPGVVGPRATWPASPLLLGMLLGVAVAALTLSTADGRAWRAAPPPAPLPAAPAPVVASPVPAAPGGSDAVAAATAELITYAFPAPQDALLLDEPEPEPRLAEPPRASGAALPDEAAAAGAPVANGSADLTSAPLVERPGSISMAAAVTPPADVEYAALAARRARERGPALVAAFADFVARFPHHVAGRVSLAAEALRTGDSAQARAALVDGLRRDPGEYRYALMLAHLEMDAGKLDAALSVLGPATAPPAERAEHLAFVAALEQRRGAHDAAVAAYREALEHEPGRGAWWVGLGISLAARGEDGAAALAFERALGDRALSQRLREYAGREAARHGGGA